MKQNQIFFYETYSPIGHETTIQHRSAIFIGRKVLKCLKTFIITIFQFHFKSKHKHAK